MEKTYEDFKVAARRLAGHLDTLATLTSGELGNGVPRALEMMLILLVGIMKAHGFKQADVVKLISRSHEETRVTTKTPFVGKGGSA